VCRQCHTCNLSKVPAHSQLTTDAWPATALRMYSCASQVQTATLSRPCCTAELRGDPQSLTHPHGALCRYLQGPALVMRMMLGGVAMTMCPPRRVAGAAELAGGEGGHVTRGRPGRRQGGDTCICVHVDDKTAMVPDPHAETQPPARPPSSGRDHMRHTHAACHAAVNSLTGASS
jgi:hypothetical protein